MNSEDMKYTKISEFPDPDKNLLWKLCLKRREAFEEMNSDVNEVVNQCLLAKRHLEAVEDSNVNLMNERKSLRSKYEALSEKNRKDTNIIMKLKDSESALKDATKKYVKTSELLSGEEIKNKGKTLERKLLQDEREKLIFKSQTITNALRKTNIKHNRIHQKILEENKKYEENENRYSGERKELEYPLSKNSVILERWLKNNAQRDAAIRSLQDDITNGLMVHLEKDQEDVASKDIADVDSSAAETEISESVKKSVSSESVATEDESKTHPRESSKISENSELQQQNEEELSFRLEWLNKKTLFEVAEKQKEHWMDFYEMLNKRMQDLHIETVNVREWRIDKEAERNDLFKRTEDLENIVSQKRRKRPIPPRTSTEEMRIWIDIQRETNDALRKVAYKCLSIKLEESVTYSKFEKAVKDIYLDALKKQITLEREIEEIHRESE